MKMLTYARSWPKEIVALLSLALLFGGALPAGAQTEGGTGAGTGSETIDADPLSPPPPFCAPVRSSTYDVDAVGTYTGLTQGDDPPAVYAGDVEISISSDHSSGDYYIAPEGTYGNDSSCAPTSLGPLNPVPATATVFADAPDGGIHAPGDDTAPCTGTGHFWRVNTTFVAQWELDDGPDDGPCVVDGNVPPFDEEGEAPRGTLHTFEGNLFPCLQDPNDPFPDVCPDPQLQGSYQETLH